MKPSERLRQLADWCDQHGITKDDVVDIGISYSGTTAHVSKEAGERVLAGRTLDVGRSGFANDYVGRVRVTFLAAAEQPPKTITIPEAAK